MGRRDPLTPEMERELDALDRALAGDPVDVELRDLEALVHEVRATAPEMTPAFAARLEHEVSDGFPSSPERSSRNVRRPWAGRRRRVLLPAAGALAAVLVALAVVLGGGHDATPPQLSSSASPPTEAAVPAAPSGAAADSATSSAPDAPSARKVQRSAVLVIQTPDDKFESTTDAVITTVARFKGIVASSQIGSSDPGGGEATYDLRIPTGRLDQALAALSELGHVTERNQQLDDITSSFTSAQEKLTDARAERRALLRALGRATTQQQIDSLKARLRSVSSRISGRKGEIAALRRRADLSTVSLTVRGGGAASQSGGSGGGDWTPGDAAGDALRVLEVSAGVALVCLAVLAPLGLLGAAIALGVRGGRRRRREAALDAT